MSLFSGKPMVLNGFSGKSAKPAKYMVLTGFSGKSAKRLKPLWYYMVLAENPLNIFEIILCGDFNSLL